ncbi:hypothetical protein FKW77_008916 [Venturia effusa]|uniref:Uncharacterized protein n=1 Tax=Venturia effusa TaxID=50376 RepID=A0A517L006_9PEZI|nr:hypothetical protein FKW77_008916 [Venturia effusa]
MAPRTEVIRVRRSEVQPGDVILGPAPLERSVAPRRPRPQYSRRSSSLDGDKFFQLAPSRRRELAGRRDPRDENEQQYDSEGSVPPRARRPLPARQSRQRDGRERSRNAEDDTSSSVSSSDLGCTDDDEKSKKKARLKKWGAIGLAGVATIHAVSGVHSTIEKRKKRQEELAHGDISEEEAERRRNKGRWKNAANVGIAAVWIKGAVDEIKEYREVAKEYEETCEKGEERHRRRVERAKAITRGEYQGTHKLTPEERRHHLRQVEEESERGRRG